MRALLVDTNVVSYIYRHDSRAALYEPHLHGAFLSISFMTLAELERWAVSANWGAQKHGDLMRMVGARFNVIESSPALCRQWAEVADFSRRIGHSMNQADAWIAATALLYRMPLVTHNAADFAHVAGLSVITES